MKNFDTIKINPFIKITKIGEDGFCGFYKTRMFFIFSHGDGWEHLSVSYPNRTPSWDEMCDLKDAFWDKSECCVQYHPAESDYVNMHPYCLHIWKPTNSVLPVPPPIMVGLKGGAM